MKRILIIRHASCEHIQRFLKSLASVKDSTMEIDLFSPTFSVSVSAEDLGLNNIYHLNVSSWKQKICRLRKLGVLFIQKEIESYLEQLLLSKKYDLVNVHYLPNNVNEYVNIAHKCGVKIMLTPFGSDVLRANKIKTFFLNKAIAKSNYISFPKAIGFADKLVKRFNISTSKIIDLGYGSETISSILSIEGKYTRKELVEMLGISYSDYYITCGYNASLAQHHSEIIEAIAKNKELLPSNYCLLFPLSYGADKDLIKSTVDELCEKYDLKYSLFLNYLSVEQVAALRLITNLFIHVQDTDAYSASLQEFLLTKACVINGKWLEYPSLERFGFPYYQCESLNNLSNDIRNVVLGKYDSIVLHNEVREEICNNAWDRKIIAWKEFYNTIY